MEIALGVICTLLLFMLGWIVAHSTQCSAFHERVASLEEWRKHIDGRGRDG